MAEKIAIVGSNNRTRNNAPWNDPDFDIWIFNEAGACEWVKGPISGIFQLHREEVYRNPENWSDRSHWAWLQLQHPFPIYMQAVDPLVPASVPYPLGEITREFLSDFQWDDGHLIPFFTSTPCFAMALAIFQGYGEIHLYGIEAESNTEYSHQRPGITFWTGVAVGRGIKVVQHCGNGIYQVPIYGYDGEIQIPAEDYLEGIDKLIAGIGRYKGLLDRARDEADLAMHNGGDGFEEKWKTLLGITRDSSVPAGILQEARRYHDKVKQIQAELGKSLISRQEYEINAKRASDAMDRCLGLMNFEGGRSWQAWMMYKQTGSQTYLDLFEQYSENQLEFARKAGELEGIRIANQTFLKKADDLVRAAGGEKAVGAFGG